MSYHNITNEEGLMGNIYIARHGQTDWNLQRRLQGQQNPKLNALGRSLAIDIAKYLMRHTQNINLIYSSALDRAVETARIIAQHFKTRYFRRKDLNEMCFGELEGRLESDISSQLKEYLENKAQYQFPRGENYDLVSARVKKVVKKILIESQKFNVLIVGHQAVNRVILGTLLDFPKEMFANIDQPHHLIFEITERKILFCHDIEKKKRTSFHLNDT